MVYDCYRARLLAATLLHGATKLHVGGRDDLFGGDFRGLDSGRYVMRVIKKVIVIYPNPLLYYSLIYG